MAYIEDRIRGHFALRKHAYSNILKILPPKNENFQIKNPDNFHISAQNNDKKIRMGQYVQGTKQEIAKVVKYGGESTRAQLFKASLA